ncbi:beta-1,3-galactosyltransferase 5-like [Daphnia pulex]|uniref:beta-1,3-galactosyltransferase 5-like n=1 Tax=Daphnia pulex TaxID=6669 RepID=UPI001EDD9C4E|nr:beta-1,3-galactosyltransferase 5-like [Daphnia pulex]
MKITVKILAIFLTLLVFANSQLMDKMNRAIVVESSAEKMNRAIEAANEDRKLLYSQMAPDLIDIPYPGVENYTHYAAARLGLLLVNARPLMSELGPVINDVTSFKYPIATKQCGNINSSVRSVFIAVISATGNFEKRSKIRETWKNHIDLVLQKGLLGKIHFGFILGQPENANELQGKSKDIQEKIQDENDNFGDIIQIEMLDFYRNLPLKMAGLLNWVITNCRQVDFVLKIDDDMYLNVHVLAHFVKTYYESGKMTIFGQSDRVDSKSNNWGPQRSASQWKISLDEWPWNTYPNYVNGPVYLMHKTAIVPLLAAIQTTPIMPFENIYLTGICSEKAGVRTQYSSGPNSIVKGSAFSSNCDADKYLTWNSFTGGMPHSDIDSFYRSSFSWYSVYSWWRCTPKESVQFNFRNDMSAI